MKKVIGQEICPVCMGNLQVLACVEYEGNGMSEPRFIREQWFEYDCKDCGYETMDRRELNIMFKKRYHLEEAEIPEEKIKEMMLE